MTPLEILQKARALISNEANWTTYEAARDEHGDSVDCDSHGAVRWCAIGAVSKAGWDSASGPSVDAKAIESLRMAVTKLTGRRSIAGFNDNSSHAGVLAAFDLAISNLSTAGVTEEPTE